MHKWLFVFSVQLNIHLNLKSIYLINLYLV